jgi:hypothetical protein
MSNPAVDHPSHYGGDTTYEAIKVLKAWGLEKDAYLWNVGKYLARAGKKDDLLQDLEKMAFYLNQRIADEKASRESQAFVTSEEEEAEAEKAQAWFKEMARKAAQ